MAGYFTEMIQIYATPPHGRTDFQIKKAEDKPRAITNSSKDGISFLIRTITVGGRIALPHESHALSQTE